MPDVFRRAFRLSIEIDGKLKTYQELTNTDESLKVDFNITNCVYGVFAQGNITIYNLGFDDMQYLATSYNPASRRFKRNKIILEAGYNDNVSNIINGNIIEVDADFNSVDASINLRVQGAIANNLANNNVKTSLNGDVDFRAVCNECAKNNGLTLHYDSKIKPRTLTDFSYNGTPYQMIERLRKYYPDTNIFLGEDGQTLNVLLKEGGENFNQQELSKDTGLKGRPKPTMLGCVARSVLNTNFKAGGYVKLKNSNLENFDGVYRITELKHIGSNRGEAWDTELTLQRARNG